MRVVARHLAVLAAFCAAASSVTADEIKLKDGKKLYGVIVGYEDNMFRVKTEFGFVLVEKDKIASIVPTAPAGATAAAKASPAPRPAEDKAAEKAAREAAAAANTPGEPSADASSKPKITDAPVKPSLPTAVSASKVTPPAIKPSAPANPVGATPKEPEPPVNREEVQGTLYTNYSHRFRMYKAPSWNLIGDARQALPNAIVAMGTSNESTLMGVGQEKTKDSLETSAAAVEKRLREIYSNYRMISQRTTGVGRSPAIEY